MSDYLKESKYLDEILIILRIMKKLNIQKKDLILNKQDVKDITKLLAEMFKKCKDDEEKPLIIECLSHFLDNRIKYKIFIIH